MTRLTATCTLLLIVACGDAESGSTDGSAGAGGSGASGGSSGTAGGTTLPEPAVHRASAEMCSGLPPPGQPLDGAGGECMTDTDCVAGDNGRCIWPFGGTNRCYYDECTTDSDCGGQAVCACRVDESFMLNRCFLGNCVTDGDCPGGFCSPSAVNVTTNCFTDISPGSIGYFCRTAEDECLDDPDCGDAGARCIFSVEATHWVCHDLLCTN